MQDYSEKFYTRFAGRYAEVAHQYLQSVYIRSSHPRLKGDVDLIERLLELAPGKKGLDAGCGAGARDVWNLFRLGYDVTGVDAVAENIQTAIQIHPEISSRVQIHNLNQPLPFPDNCYDFAMCNAVIQHIDPDDVFNTVLPELSRVIRPGGVLQLMFKNGEGCCTVYDKDYGVDRCFLLYDEHQILACLKARGLTLIEASGDALGGIMYFTDPKETDHCVFYASKQV